MDTPNLIDFVRSCFAEVVSTDKASLIDILNKNGFPAPSSISDNDLILKSLNAVQVSDSFKDNLHSLMLKCSQIKDLHKYRGFAAQPAGGGMINILSGKDLTTTVKPNNGFLTNPIFNNCKNCNEFKK